MNVLALKDRNSSRLGTIYYIMGLLMLVGISLIDSRLYGFMMTIIKNSLSIIIVVLIINSNKSKMMYINLIGGVYILSSIVKILGVLTLGKIILTSNLDIITSLIETLVIFISIRYIYKNDLDKKSIVIVLLVVIIFFILFLSHIKIDANLVTFDNINTIDIFLLINMPILIYSIKICFGYIKYNGEDNDELIVISQIMLLKIIYCIIFIFINRSQEYDGILYIFIDLLSILQIYLVYKITIDTSLINPYLYMMNINKKIDEQSKLQENTNFILEKVNKLQCNIREKLIYKEEFFNSILMATPNGWATFDEEGNITYFNNAFGNIVDYEYDIDLSIKKNILNSNEFSSNVLKACKEKCTLENEITNIRNEIYKCVYRSDYINGGCICIIVNISKEKEILNDLIELKKEYEDLIMNIKSPVIISDELDNIIKINKSYEDIFNKHDENTNFHELLIHPDDIDKFKHIKEINKKAVYQSELYNNGIFRYRIVNANGDVLWLESYTTLYYEGDRKYIITSYSNITEYIKTENNLKRSNDMYTGLLDRIPEGIYLEELETNRYVYINKKFKDIFGVDKYLNEEYSGVCRKDLMKIHPDYEEEVDLSIKEIKQNKVSNYKNLKYLDKEGRVIEAQVASIPFKLENKILKLTIIKEMEEVKYLENLKMQIVERKKRDLIKMEFFINMSHELKTPLNLIFISTQLLDNLCKKGKILDKENHIKKHIGLTMQNSYRLLKIINDLIDFTKMESGFYKVRMENKDIILVIEDIVMSVVSYADNKGIDLIFDTNIEELEMAVDVNAIERIILNILSNSIKFTNSGGSIYVSIVYNINTLDIVIEDTGIGIPDDKIDFIFERFNDVNKGYIGNVYGSGIGLSMVKLIANLIDAKISVSSKLGVGTKFVVTIDVRTLDKVDELYIDKYENLSNVERLTVGMTDIYK